VYRAQLPPSVTAAVITLSIAASSPVYAYGEKDAIKDCESRLRSEYHLSDFRHQQAEKLPGEGHKYKVTGKTKVEGDKHPFGCQIEDRHVTSIQYDGPEPEGMSGAQKLAVGAAAAVAAGLIASELSKDDEEKTSEATSTHTSTSHTSSTRSANPSFDCTKASHEVEELICKDAELADLDRSLAELYPLVLKHTPASEQRTLKAEQRGWVKGRDDCWKASDERGCVKSEYEARIAELKDR
jgi:uncharacterized protein YecT (DUF1311 family)